MEDYKKMYYRLFSRVSDIIEELQNAQRETEEMFLRQSEERTPLKLYPDKQDKAGENAP